METKEKFVELRAKGLSYQKIAEQLGVTKQTLINWSRDFEMQISNLKAVELDSLSEQFYVTKAKRIELLGKQLEKLKEEIKTRDLSTVPTDKLFDLLLKYSTVLKEEYITPEFRVLEHRKPVDFYTEVNTWNG